MVRDAESHADEDEKRARGSGGKNRASQLIYQTEKQLKDLADKVPADVRETTESALGRLKSALESNDFESIRAATDEVQQSMYRLSELLYQQSSQQYTADGATAEPDVEGHAGSENADSDVINAEYKAQ